MSCVFAALSTCFVWFCSFKKNRMLFVELCGANRSVVMQQMVEAAAVPSAGGAVVPPALVSVSGFIFLPSWATFKFLWEAGIF